MLFANVFKIKHFDGVSDMYEMQRKPHSVVSDRLYDTSKQFWWITSNETYKEKKMEVVSYIFCESDSRKDMKRF